MGKIDGILDDVVVNTKAAASAVSKKAATVYDASKHKITAANIRGDINKKLRELGKYTYKAKACGADMDEQIDQVITEITELKDNLEIINAHIDEIKNQKKCPNCEAKLPRNSNFCNVCGTKIDVADEVIDEVDVTEDVVDEPAEEAPAEPAEENAAEEAPAE